MKQVNIDGTAVPSKEEFENLKNTLLVTDDTPQLASGADLNDFFAGFRTCENVPLKNSPVGSTFYGAILGLKINNGMKMQIAIIGSNQMFMRTYMYRGGSDFSWDSSWTQIGGGN